MDEYIKREDALDAVLFALAGTGHQSTAIYAIREVPTADVVPKSELSIIGVQNMALENTNVDLQRRLVIAEAVASSAVGKASEMIAEAKRGVAREIFEEIDSMIFGTIIPDDCAIISIARLAEIKKKYTGAKSDE